MEKLINIKKTLMISSIDKGGEPTISYSTYVMKECIIYIYISKLAPHYKNIEDNPLIDVMIIEDEDEAKSLFSRRRVSFKCIAEKLEAGTEEILLEFEKSHGSGIINLLKKLDFDIFKLNIKNGKLVTGFGKDFEVILEGGEFVLRQLEAKDFKGEK